MFKILHNELLKCAFQMKGPTLGLYRCLERRSLRATSDRLAWLSETVLSRSCRSSSVILARIAQDWYDRKLISGTSISTNHQRFYSRSDPGPEKGIAY